MLCVSVSWQQIDDYIDLQFEQYFRDESGLNRRNIQDNRVHCCLYFISPFSHGYADAGCASAGAAARLGIFLDVLSHGRLCVLYSLRPLDVECMKALHEKVNIVPVLAKADSLTRAEVCRKKMKV